MQRRADVSVCMAVMGGMAGFLVGVGLEWGFGTSETWPTGLMIASSVALAITCGWFLGTVETDPEDDELIRSIEEMGVKVYVDQPGCSAVDALIEELYCHENATLNFGGRMKELRPRRITHRKPGELFKEYMEGSDPLDR